MKKKKKKEGEEEEEEKEKDRDENLAEHGKREPTRFWFSGIG